MRLYFVMLGLAIVALCPLTLAQDFKFSSSDKVVTTDSGLQYVDVKVGRGDEIKASHLAVVHYVLKLDDGSEVDSSRKSGGRPFRFHVGRGEVIKGWDEGVAGMRIGGTRKLRLPSELAYGDKGVEGVIPGNATLWFTVEAIATVDPATLASNEKVKKTSSGVEFVDVLDGTGRAAKKGDQVSVLYALYNDKREILDTNTRGNSRPLAFTLGEPGIITGFDEGVQGMKVGSIRKLKVPAALGYGDKGSGPIQPGQTLWFVVELVQIR